MHIYSTPHPQSEDDNETFGLLNLKLEAMLKRVVHSLGLVQHTERKSRRKNQLKGAVAKASADFRLQPENIFVKIVHEGGQKELYEHAVPASKLMEKYPGMCVALPEVFKDPHQSVLWPEEILMPGQKYILISCKAVEKLKRKHPEEGKTVLETKITMSLSGHSVEENGKIEVSNGVGHEIFGAKTSLSSNKIEEEGEIEEANKVRTVKEAFCSAKDFYVSKDKYTTRPKRKGIKGKKPFVPPLPKAKPFRNLGWQPSLSPVEELSA